MVANEAANAIASHANSYLVIPTLGNMNRNALGDDGTGWQSLLLLNLVSASNLRATLAF